ncbi:MAG: DEAD/DEAH box helicase family protein [Nitrospirae bacterium]|nr:DEAD/DEAH box helicase family protein [Nitrospirota bacterium]
MPPGPEDIAREQIDRMLVSAGWVVQDTKAVNLYAKQGVAIREFELKSGYGTADYLLYVGGKAAGVIEAKKEGTTLTGVEIQSDRYKNGLPDSLPAWFRPLPFCYQSTSIETRFTNGFDPEPRSRNVFSFHQPETMAKWLEDGVPATDDHAAFRSPIYGGVSTLNSRIRQMPPLIEDGLWPAQIVAIKNLEKSLSENRPRALIQMATGSGKTFTAINFLYRLIKFGGAKRVLFLVDRGNLGRQALKEFQQYLSPYNNFKFTEEYIAQRLTSNTLDTTARVCICTIQRLYSMLKGVDLPEEGDEVSAQGLDTVYKEVPPLEYNPAIPIETFDIIVTDECHRSIYNLWRQVLEYFDASIIGLTATPNKQTFGFFNQNLVMEYGHEQAVADGVNVNYDVYRIKTAITEGGGKVEAGFYVDKRDRETRAVRWERLDEDLAYDPDQLDRQVVTPDQIRTVVRTYRDKVLTEIFPGRTWVPKTLIFAKDDSHAEDIVKIVREEFAKGNDFCQKITYRTTGRRPEDLIAEFRTSPMPRIAVTVDMIATGTDIKPLEVVLFMRSVKSRSFFEQMKGRGVRIINDDDLKAVTPDARTKDHFIIVDAVGVCEQDKTDSRPMEKKRNVSFEKLLQFVSLGNIEPEVISSIAVRMARMEHAISAEDHTEIRKLADKSLKILCAGLITAIDPDRQVEQAKLDNPGAAEPSEAQIQKAAAVLIQEAVKPLHNPELRKLLVELKKKSEQTIDVVSQDRVIEAGFSAQALEKAKGLVQSFEQFIKDHKDEITALQVLYSMPYKQRLRYEDIKDLASRIEKPPHQWRVDNLWNAYAALEKSKVKGASAPHILTDLVSLVRFAMHRDDELVPFPERVNANFEKWMAQTIRHSRESGNPEFTKEQIRWLEMIRDHIAANLSIEADDFDFAPFAQEGGIGRVHQIFGNDLNKILDELNGVLAA